MIKGYFNLVYPHNTFEKSFLISFSIPNIKALFGGLWGIDPIFLCKTVEIFYLKLILRFDNKQEVNDPSFSSFIWLIAFEVILFEGTGSRADIMNFLSS